MRAGAAVAGAQSGARRCAAGRPHLAGGGLAILEALPFSPVGADADFPGGVGFCKFFQI